MARRCSKQQFEEIVKSALSVVPLSNEYEVKFERRTLDPEEKPGWVECVDQDSAKFKVVVGNRATVGEATEIIIHEMAHILDWKPYTPWTQNHGPTWGVHYAEIYRAYFQVL